VVLAVLGVAAWIAVREYYKSQAANAKPKATPALPVVATQAHQGDIPVYFTGLGAVTPLYTITIKTRVDGQIMKVNYTEGQSVEKGQSLVEIDPRPYEVQLTQAEGQLVRDKALLDNALIDLQRYETLIKKNAVAEQIYATQKSTVAQDEGNVRTDQGNIDSAKLNLVYCHITAPISGRAGLRLVDPGNLVQAASATPLVVLTQTEPISVIFTIGEDQVPAVMKRVRAGEHLKVEAWDKDLRNFLANGELTTLDNQIDQTTGTLKLRATFPNKGETLFPNQFVNAKLLVENKKNVTLVPNAAIQRNGSSTFLYMVQPDNKVAVRNVKIGTTGADESEVLSDDIKPGDVLVTQGVDKLQDGTLVKAQVQPPANPQANAASSNSGTNNPSSGQGNNSGTATGGHHNKNAGGSSPTGANSHP
jgi:membrane fusion protein, multidrug efflux system